MYSERAHATHATTRNHHMQPSRPSLMEYTSAFDNDGRSLVGPNATSGGSEPLSRDSHSRCYESGYQFSRLSQDGHGANRAPRSLVYLRIAIHTHVWLTLAMLVPNRLASAAFCMLYASWCSIQTLLFVPASICTWTRTLTRVSDSRIYAMDSANDISTVGGTLGAVELGILVATLLMGIYLLQAWNYFRNFPEDPWWLRSLVAMLTLLELTESSLLCYGLWFYTVIEYGNVDTLDDVPPILCVTIAIAATGIFLVQCLFSYRVLKLTQSKTLSVVCFTLASLRWVFNWTQTSLALATAGYNYASSFRWAVVAALVTGAVSDIVIAAPLCRALLRSRSGISRTNTILDRLIIFIVGTGLITSLFATTELICFFVMDNLLFFGVVVFSSKVYPNCLLASLNERVYFREDSHISLSYDPGHRQSSGRDVFTRSTAAQEISIQLTAGITRTVDIEVTRDCDLDDVSTKKTDGFCSIEEVS